MPVSGWNVILVKDYWIHSQISFLDQPIDIVLRSASRYRSYHKPCSFELSDLKSAI